MFDKANNHPPLDIEAFVWAGNSADKTLQGSEVPCDPRVKCIQWSTSDLSEKRRLKVLSMTGDFSIFGIVNSNTSAKQNLPLASQRQVFEMLREPQLQEIRAQFETAIVQGRSSAKLELKLYGDDVFWVEQETKRLQSVSTKDETVARLGGDEFAVLLTNLKSKEFGTERAEEYLESLKGSFDIDGRELHVGGSLGISFFPEDSDSPEAIVQHADWAMYTAKASGRNICQPFTPQIAKQTLHRFNLENDLHAAIEKNEDLFLEFQPKLEMGSKRVASVEALVRWSHPKHGLISPKEFIPIAEETGQVVPLGELIMRDACRTVAGWNR